MEHTQTNGPIRGISRRFTLPVRPETPGRCTGRKPEGLSRESARKKKNVRPCKPDVSVHFADIQRLLAEREGYEPISPKILIIKVITISKNTLVTI